MITHPLFTHHSKFVVGMASLNRKFNKLQIVELAFSAFDKDGVFPHSFCTKADQLFDPLPTMQGEAILRNSNSRIFSMRCSQRLKRKS